MEAVWRRLPPLGPGDCGGCAAASGVHDQCCSRPALPLPHVPRCACCARRDRRYEYKGLTKTWKGKLDEAKVGGRGRAERVA